MSDLPADPFQLYADLSTPAVITNGDYRIVYLNPSAETFWQTRLPDVAGQFPQPALHLAPPEGRDVREWVRDVFFPALTTGDPFACQTTDRDGRRRPIQFAGTRFLHNGDWYMLLTLLSESATHSLSVAPNWALTDPLTGLHNRHHWERELPERNARGGTVVFFDLNDLHEINDLSGHRAGDEALAMAGRAIAAEAPEGALLVRYGGDEFVMAVEVDRAADITEVANRIVARAAAAAQEAGLSLPLQLSFGVAAFAPGDLAAAVQRADDAMYEHKGVLMRGEDGDRIVLTRAGRGLVRRPGVDPEEQRPGTYAASFGAEFDSYFRQMFARAAEQAREFVAFVGPRSGEAVVEVGAGSGRITFDGGLAQSVGPGGQLLVTDPSAAQLQVARRRAQDLGLDWVRFLQAPVEDLPLASGTVGLVLGSTFLHFTDPAVALRSMARIVRPGGRVAVNAILHFRLGDGWAWAMEAVAADLRTRGLPFDFLPPQATIEAAFTGAGLQIDRVKATQDERAEYPNAEVALGFTRQVGLVRQYLRGAPDERVRALEQVFEGRMREGFGRTGWDWSMGGQGINILAHRPE